MNIDMRIRHGDAGRGKGCLQAVEDVSLSVREGDRLKTVVVYTKMCRGEMTRYILKNRIGDPQQLKAFEWEGFRQDAALSKADDWVFTM